MRRLLLALLLLGAAGVGLVAAGNVGLGPVVITREDEQKIILLLSQARRVTQPGLSLRWPLIETAERFDRRWLYLNTEPATIQTRDGETLTVDNYAIWRIEDAIAFKRSFRQVIEAEERLDRAVKDDVREVVGRHTLREVLTDKRADIMQEITEKTRATAEQFGVRIADVRINRTELPDETMESVYARMRTERERLARKNRAEGELGARRVRAEADAEARVIVAEARRDAEIERGRGEAEATRIYAEAYGGDAGFYDFLRSLEAYRKTIGSNTTLVLSPRSEFFRFLESSAPGANGGVSARPPRAAPPAAAAPAEAAAE
jgi:membrane protease subunit HflC